MICARGTKMNGLNLEEVKIKCSANYGTPRWILFDNAENIPKCLKSCKRDEDCSIESNTGNDSTNIDGYKNSNIHEVIEYGRSETKFGNNNIFDPPNFCKL